MTAGGLPAGLDDRVKSRFRTALDDSNTPCMLPRARICEYSRRSGPCRKIVFKGIAKASPDQEALFELDCSRFFNQSRYSATRPGAETSWVDAHWPFRLYILK